MTSQKSFFTFKFDPPEPKKQRRPKRLRAAARPLLTIGQILEWADAHHGRTGRWPSLNSGPVQDNRNESWGNIDRMLQKGTRGLPGGSSLARLLAEQRGRRNHNNPPVLTVEQILAWADAHYERTGRWPAVLSGAIAGVPGETWRAVELSLYVGRRGLPGGTSLARLLAERRGVRNEKDLSRLTAERILNWADAYFGRAGRWPTSKAGPVDEAPGEIWENINAALIIGLRGLPGGSSLARLFAEQRGRRNHMNLPPLRIPCILNWADGHFRRTGRWPTRSSGTIEDAPGETWSSVNSALTSGLRGLAGGTSLGRLLAQRRGYRYQPDLPIMTEALILDWADAHFDRTGCWPFVRSGPIVDAPGETWNRVDNALIRGQRGLPGGNSLADLLQKHQRRRNFMNLPPLTPPQILRWAKAHFRRTGRWPTVRSGPIVEAPGETWCGVHGALVAGRRGLSGGSSLARFLVQHRCKLPYHRG